MGRQSNGVVFFVFFHLVTCVCIDGGRGSSMHDDLELARSHKHDLNLVVGIPEDFIGRLME